MREAKFSIYAYLDLGIRSFPKGHLKPPCSVLFEAKDISLSACYTVCFAQVWASGPRDEPNYDRVHYQLLPTMFLDLVVTIS